MSTLERHIKSLRGEEQDLTGLGLRRIFLDGLGRVLNIEWITKEQYEDYKKLSNEDYIRRGGKFSY